jgi:hypothetical protein
MRNSQEVNTLEQIRAKVERACDLLRAPSPAAVDGCAVELGSALLRLGEWKALLQAHPETSNRLMLDEALRLRTTVRRAARLLRTASNYHDKWRQTLGALCAGYTVSGAPAAAARPGRLCLRG